MQKINQKGFRALQVLLLIVLVGIIGGTGLLVYKAQKDTNRSLDNTNNNLQQQAEDKQRPATNDRSKEVDVVSSGVIKGIASYPSEKLPEDQEVCAEDITDSKKTHCIDVGHEQKTSFELTVPVGEYYVYSKTAKLENYRAYYNEFVKCGLSVDCPESGHKQYISVKVGAGETVSGIEPGDWYDMSQ